MAGKQTGSKRSELAAPEVAEAAMEHIGKLTGKQSVGVVSLERTDDGWQVGVEVVEGARVPSSADLLAVYQVDLDAAGELLGYRRRKRYQRGSSESEVS